MYLWIFFVEIAWRLNLDIDRFDWMIVSYVGHHLCVAYLYISFRKMDLFYMYDLFIMKLSKGW